MGLICVHEPSPRWDARKQRIVGDAPASTFSGDWSAAREEGSLIPGDWWRIEEDGETVGYGWMDVTWGDAEILLATAPESRRHGIGSYILEQLGHIATERGLNYLYNVVPAEHPDAASVSAWLEKRGFVPAEDGRLLRATAAAARTANG